LSNFNILHNNLDKNALGTKLPLNFSSIITENYN
jgi:hypothetical protein